jgi:hypothetical protein
MPRQLPSGRWLGCRHLKSSGELIGFDARKAAKAKDPSAGYTGHYHDH